jgi:GNAT superfamily N-acetyltransferase
MIRIETLTARSGLGDRLEDIAKLRIAVFRDWPYLDDGDLAYERNYLGRYVRSAGAVCVAAYEGARMIGASTGMPLAEEHEPIKAPFVAGGFDLSRIYYCAESVLLKDYRGRGVYRRFFEEREAHARRLGGFDTVAFCGVVRPDDHPLRPADDRPLDRVWQHFGYARRDDLVCYFSWKDVDRAVATEKPMRFWLKPLEGPDGDRR